MPIKCFHQSYVCVVYKLNNYLHTIWQIGLKRLVYALCFSVHTHCFSDSFIFIKCVRNETGVLRKRKLIYQMRGLFI